MLSLGRPLYPLLMKRASILVPLIWVRVFLDKYIMKPHVLMYRIYYPLKSSISLSAARKYYCYLRYLKLLCILFLASVGSGEQKSDQ